VGDFYFDHGKNILKKSFSIDMIEKSKNHPFAMTFHLSER